MIAVLAVIVGSAIFYFIWRGTKGQGASVRFAARGAGLVLLGALVIGGLLIVTDPGENLKIVDAGFVSLAGAGREIAGAVENRTDHAMAPVRLEVDFIDSGSRIIDTSIIESRNLAAGGRWDFRLPVPSDSVAGFRARVGSPDNVRPAWLGGGCGSTLCR